MTTSLQYDNKPLPFMLHFCQIYDLCQSECGPCHVCSVHLWSLSPNHRWCLCVKTVEGKYSGYLRTHVHCSAKMMWQIFKCCLLQAYICNKSAYHFAIQSVHLLFNTHLNTYERRKRTAMIDCDCDDSY